MFEVKLSEELKAKCPTMVLGTLFCDVENSASDKALWTEINSVIERITTEYTLETIKENPQIAATRTMYKACGKQPSRYRPAAEALMRRILKGQGLYKINTLVDLVNLLSLETGFSLGGFDASRVEGNVVASIAKEGTSYEGIGRGNINITGLPVLCDAFGPIGTPTSDEERTKLKPETTRLYLNINGYVGSELTQFALNRASELLENYANAKHIQHYLVN